MTRKEKIKDLEKQIEEKQDEIRELRNHLKDELVADFHERHNLKEGQHFMYGNKECVGVRCESYYFKTNAIRKNGEISKNAIWIYDESKIKPIES